MSVNFVPGDTVEVPEIPFKTRWNFRPTRRRC